MRFLEGSLPFTAPVVQFNQNNNDTPVAMEVDNVVQEGIGGEPNPLQNGGERSRVQTFYQDEPDQVHNERGIRRQVIMERGESSRQNDRLAGGSNEGRHGLPPDMGDLNPYYGLDNDEHTYVNDFDLLLQDSIADRLEGNVQRAWFLDDERGFYQTFSMDVAIPLFYNEPPSPINEDMGNEVADMEHNINEDDNEEGVNAYGDEGDAMGDDSPQSTEEWPDMGGDSSEDGSPLSIMGMLNSSGEESPQDDWNEDAIGDNNQQTITVSDHDSMPMEEAPWDLLVASVIGDYQENTKTVSDSGVVNATIGRGDFWRRVIAMPRFKKKGSQRKEFKKHTEGEEIKKVVEGGKQKRETMSDPCQRNYRSEEQNSEGSITSACKRFCVEGRAWIDRLNSGEGTSRQHETGMNNVQFWVEYTGENTYAIEDMIDSNESDDSVGDNKEHREEDTGIQGNLHVEYQNNEGNDRGTLDGERTAALEVPTSSGFEGVGREQPSHSP